MEGQLFYIGQEVTPNTKQGCYEAMFGKIYTVLKYTRIPVTQFSESGWAIQLAECPLKYGFPEFFAQEAFSPIVTDKQLIENLSEIKTEVPS